MAQRAAFVFVLCIVAAGVSAIHFYLEPGQRRCFTEELPTQTRITGEARVASGKSDMEIDVWITTVDGRVLYHKRAPDHGKFSFQTPLLSKRHEDIDEDYDYGMDEHEEDTYKICIEHQQNPSRAHPAGTRRLIKFRLNQSFNGDRGSQNAASAHDTDNLQETMRRMHTTLSGMIGDLSQLQRREKNLTNRLQRTTSRITFLAIVSLIVTLGTSALQFKYYQGYFKQKKLC